MTSNISIGLLVVVVSMILSTACRNSGAPSRRDKVILLLRTVNTEGTITSRDTIDSEKLHWSQLEDAAKKDLGIFKSIILDRNVDAMDRSTAIIIATGTKDATIFDTLIEASAEIGSMPTVMRTVLPGRLLIAYNFSKNKDRKRLLFDYIGRELASSTCNLPSILEILQEVDPSRSLLNEDVLGLHGASGTRYASLISSIDSIPDARKKRLLIDTELKALQRAIGTLEEASLRK